MAHSSQIIIATELDEAGLRDFGVRLSGLIRPGDVICLSGDLGAGKTSLARAILFGLGHRGEVPSPTFMLAEPYPDLPVPILHADLYRLSPGASIEDLGLDAWLETGAILVEWPERLAEGQFPEALWLRLEGAGGPSRRLTCEATGAWEGRWPPA